MSAEFTRRDFLKIAAVGVGGLALAACTRDIERSVEIPLAPDAELGGQTLFSQGTIFMSDQEINWLNVAVPGLTPNEKVAMSITELAGTLGGVPIRTQLPGLVSTKKNDVPYKVLLINTFQTEEPSQWQMTSTDLVNSPFWRQSDQYFGNFVTYPEDYAISVKFASWACDSSILPASTNTQGDTSFEESWLATRNLVCGSFASAYSMRLQGMTYEEYVGELEKPRPFQGGPSIDQAVIVFDKGLYESIPTEPAWTINEN